MDSLGVSVGGEMLEWLLGRIQTLSKVSLGQGMLSFEAA